MIPIHCRRKRSSIPHSGTDLFCSASVVNTTTTHNRIMAKERATRSRKLNDKAYRNSENAVIAMPAVRILLRFMKPASRPAVQPLNMQTFQLTSMLSQRITLRLDSGSTGHYTHKIQIRTSAPDEYR